MFGKRFRGVVHGCEDVFRSIRHRGAKGRCKRRIPDRRIEWSERREDDLRAVEVNGRAYAKIELPVCGWILCVIACEPVKAEKLKERGVQDAVLILAAGDLPEDIESEAVLLQVSADSGNGVDVL